jgi:hypothetical protein
MDKRHHVSETDDAEARDILLLAGGAALIVLGAGLAMAHPGIRKSVKAALTAVAPDLEEPLKAGVRGMMPDFERYLKMKGM